MTEIKQINENMLHTIYPDFKDDIKSGEYKKYVFRHPKHLDEILISLVEYHNTDANKFKAILTDFIKLGLNINKTGNYRLFSKYDTTLLNRLCELRKYYLIKVCVALGASVEGTDLINSVLSANINYNRETLKTIKFLIKKGSQILLDEQSVEYLSHNLDNEYGKEIDSIIVDAMYDFYVGKDTDYALNF